MTVDLRLGDCVEVIKTLADSSVDSVVTDPPYELGFMGKGWDASGIAYSVEMWREVLRVLKPGGYLLAFGGTRTYHRMAVAIEDAGFEIRDSIHWIYGSGFPKSLDVSKAIDKESGAERKVVGTKITGRALGGNNLQDGFGSRIEMILITAPATDAAKQWSGWGTALKPAHEPIVVARKPFVGTVAANVQAHGTGAMNIDACRLMRSVEDVSGWSQSGSCASKNRSMSGGNYARDPKPDSAGRWPPNILLSHTPECVPTGTRKVKTGVAVKHRSGGKNIFSDVNKPASADQTYANADGTETVEAWDCAEGCAVAEMDRQSGVKSGKGTLTVGGPPRSKSAHIQQMSEQPRTNAVMDYGDSGGASRFFPVFRYQAKAARSERGEVNKHPTVKPVALMRWLVRLVTPPDGVVLEPFMGSGTTGVACVNEGFSFIGIEREPEYFEISKARIEHAQAEQPAQKELFK